MVRAGVARANVAVAVRIGKRHRKGLCRTAGAVVLSRFAPSTLSPSPANPTMEDPVSLPPPIPPAPVKTVQGLAIASLVLGIFSLLGGGMLLLIPPILAVIFGHMALSRADRDPLLGGRGLAIGGLVTGYIGFVFFGIGLLAAMAIPAFNKVRETSLQKMMLNDARQIAAAAQMEMIDYPGVPVSFRIDPATGRVSGPLAKEVAKVMVGTVEVDGTFENDHDGFSLRNPRVAKGRVFSFDVNGRPVP